MDPQVIFNVLVAIIGVLGGWLLKSFYEAIQELRKEDGAIHTRVNDVSRDIANTYVRKEDFRDALRDVKDALIRIESKLDNKMDKADYENHT